MGNWREEIDQIVISREEKELVKEVLKIKAFLDEKVEDDECRSCVVYHSLRQLQQMGLSVKVLKETMIGESVKVLRKHASNHISRASRSLLKDWRCVVDEWVESNENKTSLDPEEGMKDVTKTEPPRPTPVVNIKVTTKSDWRSKDNVVPVTPDKKPEYSRPVDSDAATSDQKSLVTHRQHSMPIVTSYEEKELVEEVLKIKAFLDEKVRRDEYGSWAVYTSLRKLQGIGLSINVLKETMIGESVGVFLKHGSKHVSRVSRSLVDEWRRVVDEWVESNEKKDSLDQEEAMKDVTITEPPRPRVVNIKVTTKSDWGKDNVVPMTPNKKLENSRPVVSDATSDQESLVTHRQQSRPIYSDEATSYQKSLVTHRQHSRPIYSDAATSDQKSLVTHRQHQRPIYSDAATSYDKGLSNTIEEKIESTKKMLQERYQELENRKQKRKIQVIEHYELPKNGRLPPKAQPVKPANKRVKRTTNAPLLFQFGRL